MSANRVRAGELDRQVTIVSRVAGARDAGGAPTKTWTDRTPPLWAKRTDVRDGERLGRDGVAATLTARFLIRDEDAGDVGVQDRIRDDDAGETFQIVGVKRIGFALREITAGAAVGG